MIINYLFFSYNDIQESNYGYLPERNNRVIEGTQQIFDGQNEIILGRYNNR